MTRCVVLSMLFPVAVFLARAPLAAQTSLNPDLSIIPRFLMETNDGERLPARRVFSQPDFSFQELEIVASAYLNPFSRADVVLTLPGPDVEAGKLGLEELYATVFRGLPLDLNLRFGKYRVEFGKLNTVHPHAWPFVTQPLMQARFLGEEGLNDLAISLSALLPTGDVYTRLNVDLLRGSAIGGATGLADTTGEKPTYALSSRLMGFFTLTDESDLEVGLSGYTGIHDPYNRGRFWYGNVDFKYKYRPSLYTSLVVQGEYLLNSRNASLGPDLQPFTDPDGNPVRLSLTTSGMYIYMDYQFMKIFSIGSKFDWAQSPYSADDRASAVAVFAGYYPVEETLGLRLQYQNTKYDMPGMDARSVNAIALQVLCSLGPHKAHPF
jgi:hypothetical protein